MHITSYPLQPLSLSLTHTHTHTYTHTHIHRGDAQNKVGLINTLNEVEGELAAAGGPFFLGPELSLVDVRFAPFVERLVASLAYYSMWLFVGVIHVPQHTHTHTHTHTHIPQHTHTHTSLNTPPLQHIHTEGFMVRGEGRFPHIEQWFDALEQRPSYLGIKSDFYTHCHDLPPQLGGVCVCVHGVLCSCSVVCGVACPPC